MLYSSGLRRIWFLLCAGLVAAIGLRASAVPALQALPTRQALQAPQAHRDLVQKYCITCHNQRLKTGGLTLESLDVERPAAHAETWEKVIRKVRGGMMPPQGMPRPDAATLDGFVAHLETSLDRAAAGHPNAGPSTALSASRPALHRLNRTEYGNAVRDLLDLEFDAAALLPPDDESEGFDNIAGVLKISPSLLEQYVSASRTIAAMAVGRSAGPVSEAFRIPPDLAQDDHIEGLPLGTRGGILIRRHFPVDAEYDVSVFLRRNIVGYMTGLEFAHQLEIAVDGERVFLVQVGGEEDNRLSDENMSAAGDAIDRRLKTRVPIKAGPRAITVAFLRKNAAESDEPLQPHSRDHDLQNMNGIPLIDYVDITGPVNVTGPGDTPSRRRLFTCAPSDACARQILSGLARRAYRRPVTDADVQPLVALYTGARATGGFEHGIEHALRGILASPKFLYRSGSAPLTNYDLASRLSFFLWSTIPDEGLLKVAGQGTLSQPAVLEQQVRRMLADRRAEALVANFAGQWLMLRNLNSFQPNGQEFPDFDDNLRQAFRRETELLFESVMREDRSVLDLLTSRETFVNERLARHYGMPGVYGTHFRRVTMPGEERRGILGHGSILTVTSYPNRTSPVLRGKWILENVLGTPPPPPPPNVPSLEESADTEALTGRALLEAHRRNPACASCHRVMDPLGFALEHFDATGEWRTRDAGAAIDASGQLADGTPVTGAATLRDALMKRPEQFVRTMTEKMLTYALGRGLEARDMPAVRAVARDAARQDYTFSSIVLGIVRSTPFLMRQM
jgi:mono/diheme cytochrome c family protein